MRGFKIPFDMHTEDKIIGGYISMRQLAWFFVGFIAIIVLFIANRGYLAETADGIEVDPLSLAIRIVIALIAVAFSIMMSFFKRDEMEMDRYSFLMILHKFKRKVIKYTDRD